MKEELVSFSGWLMGSSELLPSDKHSGEVQVGEQH